MFSSWDEAWINDPVKAMTRKLSGKTQESSPRTNIYDFSAPASQSINLSELSVNTPPSNFNRSTTENSKTPYKKKKIRKRENDFSNVFDTPNFDSSPENSECLSVTNHLKNCNKCYAQFKKLIDKKVNNKLHDIMLFNNLNRQPTTDIQSSDSWKETLIIVVGAVIVIFILYMITNSLNKF